LEHDNPHAGAAHLFAAIGSKNLFAKIMAIRHWSSVDIERDGNLVEAVIWFFLAAVLSLYALRRERRLRPTLWLLALTLAIFGGSDLVEARTGAWWRPWWLFVWKAVCVLALVVGFIRYYRLTKKISGAKSGEA
jgi:hypothetical protein